MGSATSIHPKDVDVAAPTSRHWLQSKITKSSSLGETHQWKILDDTVHTISLFLSLEAYLMTVKRPTGIKPVCRAIMPIWSIELVEVYDDLHQPVMRTFWLMARHANKSSKLRATSTTARPANNQSINQSMNHFISGNKARRNKHKRTQMPQWRKAKKK